MSTKGLEFERGIFELIKSKGWKPVWNRSSSIQQIDITASYKHYHLLIEVKAQNKPLGAPPIEKLVGILSSRPPNVIGVIFSSSKISRTAIKYLNKIISLKLIIIFDKIDLDYIQQNKVGLNELFEYKIRELCDLGMAFVEAKDFLLSRFEDDLDLEEQVKYLRTFPNCLFDIPKEVRNKLLVSMINHSSPQIRYDTTWIIPKFFDKMDELVKESFIKLINDDSFTDIYSKISYRDKNGTLIEEEFVDYYMKIYWAVAHEFIKNIQKFPNKYREKIIPLIPQILNDWENFLTERVANTDATTYSEKWSFLEEHLISTRERWNRVNK